MNPRLRGNPSITCPTRQSLRNADPLTISKLVSGQSLLDVTNT